MEKFQDVYAKHLESIKALQASIMDSVVIAIKTISVEPLEIGNMLYYYVEHNGKDVPAYMYKSDKIDNTDSGWLPIYDDQSTYEYGWSDFEECCKIFDMIRHRLINFNK